MSLRPGDASSSRGDIFARNARAISTSLPGLAAGMEEIPPARLDTFDSIDVPDVERRQLAAFATQARERTTGDALILLGLSSPAMLDELRKALPADRGLIVIEPTLDLALRLLSQYDYSTLFSSPYTSVVFGVADRDLRAELEHLTSSWGLGELQLIVNPMRPLGDTVASAVAGLLRDAIRSVELAAATGAKYARQILESIAGNLEPAAAAFDISALAGAFKGVPAFCVAAGPSLDRDIGLLREAASRGIVIAADAAVPPLMKAGIAPDVVTTIDVSDIKSCIFERHYVKDALLLALLSAHPSLVRAWIGPRAFAIDDHPLARWAARHVAPVSRFGRTGSVAHLSYALARGLGCDPVVLVGTDLAIGRKGELYASGVIHHPANKLTLAPGTPTTKVKANDGQPVETFENLLAYATALGAMATGAGTTWNTALSGVAIQNAPYRALTDVMAELPARDVARPLTGEAPLRALVIERRRALADEARELANNLLAYATDAHRFAHASDEMSARLDGGDIGGEDALRKLQPQLEEFARHADVIDLIEPLQPAITVELNRLERRTHAMSDAIERAKTRLLTFAGAGAGGAPLAEFLAERLERLIERLGAPLPGGPHEDSHKRP